MDSTGDGLRTLPLTHHLYDDMCDKWTKRASSPQPYINLTLTNEREDYKALGFDLLKRTRAVSLPVMADTGCQSCLIGIGVTQQMGLSTKDFIPVSMTMKAANNKGIRILGAVVVRFASNSGTRRLETRQIAYVTDTSDGIILSRAACMDLGMISDKFPTLGEVNLATSELCDCPRRAEPLTKPTTLPMPATEANRETLQKHLLRIYAQSTFNTCPHQPLPRMTGPPLRLMLDEDATPVAHHTPIPVAIHWQDEVKAGLDQDVRLGVLEVRQHDQYAIKIDGSGRVTLRNRKFLRKFSPVHYDRPPTRSIYDDLATRVTVPTQLPDLDNNPATPATQTGHTPPLTSARMPQHKTPPAAVTPTTPGRDTPRHATLQTPPPAPATLRAPPPSEPDVKPPAPAIGQRRSTRATSVPTWHKDYSMG